MQVIVYQIRCVVTNFTVDCGDTRTLDRTAREEYSVSSDTTTDGGAPVKEDEEDEQELKSLPVGDRGLRSLFVFK